MPPINKNKIVAFPDDTAIMVPYNFYIKSSTSNFTTGLESISRQVNIYNMDNERSILVDACIDIILERKQELIQNTKMDYVKNETLDDFPLISFDERTLHCITSTTEDNDVEVNINFCPFSIPFPVSY